MAINFAPIVIVTCGYYTELTSTINIYSIKIMLYKKNYKYHIDYVSYLK